MSGSQSNFGYRFWHDLAALFPARLINAGIRPIIAKQISVGIQSADTASQFDFLVDDDLNPSDINVALNTSELLNRADLPIDIYLSKSFFLERSHRIPSKARKDIKSILDLNLSQNTPFSTAGIVWRHEVVATKDKHLDVNQFLIKQDILSAIEAGFILHGWDVRTIRLQDSNMVFLDQSRQTNRMQRFWNRLAVFFAAAAIAATLLSAYLRYDAKIQHLEQLKTAASILQLQAIDLRVAKDEQEGAAAQIDDVIQLLNTDQSTIQILAALTNDIPDGVWISQISITTNEVRFAGFSDRPPSELVVIFEQSPLFLETRLSGPVVRDRRLERDRFEMILKRANEND